MRICSASQGSSGKVRMRGALAMVLLAAMQMAAAPATAPATLPAAPGNLRAAMNSMLHYYAAVKDDVEKEVPLEQTYRDIALFERDAAICKTMVSAGVGRLPPEKRGEAMADYRALFANLLRVLMDLEDAVRDKKADDIKNAYARINEIMQMGHEGFIPVN